MKTTAHAKLEIRTDCTDPLLDAIGSIDENIHDEDRLEWLGDADGSGTECLLLTVSAELLPQIEEELAAFGATFRRLA